MWIQNLKLNKFRNYLSQNIEFNENALVATIVRNNKIIIPTGDDYLKINDRVIIVSKDMKIVQIDDIFRRW